MLTLDQLGISESDWNQMPASGRVTIMFLLKQNQLLENRTYTFHLEVERLKTELERLKKLELEIAEWKTRHYKDLSVDGCLCPLAPHSHGIFTSTFNAAGNPVTYKRK